MLMNHKSGKRNFMTNVYNGIFSSRKKNTLKNKGLN